MMTASLINAQGIDLAGDCLTWLAKKKQAKHAPSNRASMLDDPCLRRLVYWRTQSEKAMDITPSLRGIFETGNELEPVIERILAQVGRQSDPSWRIIQSQAELQDKFLRNFNITGHIDGVLQVCLDGEWINAAVPDIKTCNPFIFNRLSDLDSLKQYAWMRKYYGQLQIYCLGMNINKGVLIFVNKTNLYEIKPIWFELDYEYAEGLLKKAESIEKYIKTGCLPVKLNRPDECSRCSFAHVCLPDLQSDGNLKLLDDSELEAMLMERQRLEPAKKQFDAIERQMKKQLIDGQDIICGDYIIQWQQIHKKGYTIEESDYWKKKILCTKADMETDEDL